MDANLAKLFKQPMQASAAARAERRPAPTPPVRSELQQVFARLADVAKARAA